MEVYPANPVTSSYVVLKGFFIFRRFKLNVMKNNFKYFKNSRKNCLFLDSNKVVALSDWHLGAGTYDDEAMKNNLFLFQALKYYCDNDYKVIMLGDTFELARNKNIEDIKCVHDDLMWLFKEIYKKGNLIIVKGNHDAYLKEKNLEQRFDTYTKKNIEFLKGVKLYNSVLLNGKTLFVHGHESNWKFHGIANRVTNFICRHDIFHSEKWFVDDPTKTSLGYEKADKTDKIIKSYADKCEFVIIAGHTHSVKMMNNYYNTGAGILNRCISCVEVIDNIPKNYKWSFVLDNENVKVKRIQLIN